MTRPPQPPQPPADGEDVLARLGVSRETAARLRTHVALLRQWQPRINLVGADTLADIWRRHVADSAELIRVAPTARRWLDLGSGAGFPGLVVASLLADAGGEVTLVESNSKKAAFLRAVVLATGAAARVDNRHAEAVIAGWTTPLDAVSARALAPLHDLLGVVAPLSARGVPAYFHKGEEVGREIDAAAADWHFDLVEHKSRFGPGVIVELRDIRPRRAG